MIDILIFLLLAILSYGLGCFSSARIIAKSFKSLNIYKVGSGHPDTENIYENVSKPLGIVVGLVDSSKIYLYLLLMKYLLSNFSPVLYTQNYMLLLGFSMLLGHCLPITNHFKGGRGVMTYIGFIAFFALYPLAIAATTGLLIIIIFNQMRFAKYMIVLLPPFISFFFYDDRNFIAKLLLAAVAMGIVNFIVSKRLGEL